MVPIKRHWSISVGFEPKDFWVGFFWRRTFNIATFIQDTVPFREKRGIEAWLNLLPMVPIKFEIWWATPAKEMNGLEDDALGAIDG